MNKIIKTAMIRTTPKGMSFVTDENTGIIHATAHPAHATAYEYTESYGFPKNIIKTYNSDEIQSLIILGGMDIKNTDAGLVFWARHGDLDNITPFYVTTHDFALYISPKKRLIKEAIRNDCGCVVE